MLYILGWLVYGLIVGTIAKLVHPTEDKISFLPTVGIGVVGSYIGGLLSWIIGLGNGPFHPAGILMSIVGGIICCWIYRNYRLNRFFQAQGRMPKFHDK